MLTFKNVISPIWLSYSLMTISIFVPGHVRLILGWTIGFITYALIYLLLGYLSKFRQFSLFRYILTTAFFLLFLPVYTFIDFRQFWYPNIMPAFTLIGITSFLCGYQFTQRMPYYLIISGSLTAIIIFILHQRIGYYVYKTYVNPKIHQAILNISPSLSFVDMNSHVLEQNELKGKVIVLDFWFTNCGICINKMNTYDSLYNHYKNRKDILILSVADGSRNTLTEIKSFCTRKQINCPVVYDKGGIVSKKYQIGRDGYPVEIRIDKAGVIREVIEGFPKPATYYTQSIKSINQLLSD